MPGTVLGSGAIKMTPGCVYGVYMAPDQELRQQSFYFASG